MAKNVSIFDGTQWVSIVGPPGKDGVDGKDGSGVTIKGTANVYPPDASPTVGDMWLTGDPVPAGAPAGTNPGDGLVWTGTEWNNVGGIRGPAGKDGKDGADGAPGKDGAGFRFVGALDGGEPLENNDVVTYEGSTYLVTGIPTRRVVSAPSGRGGDPTIPLPGGGELVLMASKGEDGSDGADGRSVNVTKGSTQPATAAIGDFWIEE